MSERYKTFGPEISPLNNSIQSNTAIPGYEVPASYFVLPWYYQADTGVTMILYKAMTPEREFFMVLSGSLYKREANLLKETSNELWFSRIPTGTAIYT